MDLRKGDFNLATLEDELRVDGLCRDLLMRFYEELTASGMPPAEATQLAGSADYYVREFVVDNRRRNLFAEQPGLVRQFAGNWYIVNTLEPNIAELGRHLGGVREFYRYLRRRGLIGEGFLQAMEAECADLDFYRQRIEAFWEISGDGYFAWERGCTLKE